MHPVADDDAPVPVGPTPRPLALALRTEVGRFRAAQHRRVFVPTVAVGDLADPGVVRVQASPCPLDDGRPPHLDQQLRTELVLGLVVGLLESGGSPGPDAWVRRPGDNGLHDEDLAWLAAARLAFGCAGRSLRRFHVLTRSGWRDVRTGEHREWVRLRL